MTMKLLASAIALAMLVSTGCISLKDNQTMRPRAVEPQQLKTREDVIRNLGIPANVAKSKGHTYYTYLYTEGYGGGAGLGNIALSLLITHVKIESDTYVVELDQADKVVDIYALAQTGDIPYSMWPFEK